MTFPLRGVLQTGLEILLSQIGKVLENLLWAHARREVVENIIDCNPHAADTGFSSSFPRFHCDDVPIIHSVTEQI
jgi:hypothetical protein